MIEHTDLKGLKFPESKTNNDPILICGHAGEICEDNGKLEVLDIPDGCMLITFTECGLTSVASLIYNAILKNKANLPLFKNPIKYQNELEELFGRKIHIHHANATNKTSRTYVNTVYGLIGEAIRGEKCHVQISGLIPLTHDGIGSIPKEYASGSAEFACSIKPSDLDFYFTGSIFPSKKQINNLGKIPLPRLVEKIPTVTQQYLFEKRPGIYFNPLCRSNECDIENVLNRQYQSSRSLNKYLNNDVEYMKNIINLCVQYDDCKLYNKKEKNLNNLDVDELISIKDYIIPRAKYASKFDNNENLDIIFKNIDAIIEEKEYTNNNNNNNFRKTQMPTKPERQEFETKLISVGAGKRKTRKARKHQIMRLNMKKHDK